MHKSTSNLRCATPSFIGHSVSSAAQRKPLPSHPPRLYVAFNLTDSNLIHFPPKQNRSSRQVSTCAMIRCWARNCRIRASCGPRRWRRPPSTWTPPWPLVRRRIRASLTCSTRCTCTSTAWTERVAAEWPADARVSTCWTWAVAIASARPLPPEAAAVPVTAAQRR